MISLREAVKQFDVSRPTLLKSLKNGKVSGRKDDSGNWLIDPSELFRVFKPRSLDVKALPEEASQALPTVSIEKSEELHDRIIRLEAEVELQKAMRLSAERLAAERGQHLDDLRRLLPRPEANDKRRKWWIW